MTNADKLSKNEGNKVYEIGFLLLPNIEETKVSGEVVKIKDIIEKKGGAFISEGTAEMRNLAYQMSKSLNGKKQKFDSAYFGWVKFEANASMINDIKKEIDGLEKVLRYMIIVTTRENVAIPPIKTRKFSFNEEEKTVVEPVVEEKPVSEELDETIDELVIE
ncbi:MAG: 30S ribosomal protein S6 [Candidatus Pacebacteria bacterium]|nr:30S ribosomal protein S6 [Candidatus Paceibacterota bacterium]